MKARAMWYNLYFKQIILTSIGEWVYRASKHVYVSHVVIRHGESHAVSYIYSPLKMERAIPTLQGYTRTY